MSVDRTEVIDALSIRDGWAVLSIHQFEPWDEMDEPDEALRRKLATYFEFVEGPTFQEKMHRRPVRIELVSRDAAPESVREVCAQLGVTLDEGE